MSRKPNHALIGAFVVGAVLLAVAAVLVLGSGDAFATKEKYVAYFPGSVKGLRVGAPVSMRGIEIGRVTSITGLMDRDASIWVEVVIEARPGAIRNDWGLFVELSPENYVARMAELGLRAQLASQSMVTGQLYVNIDYFPDTEIQLTGFHADLPEVPTVPSTDELLGKTIVETLEKISELPLVEIATSLQEAIGDLDSTLVQVGALELQPTINEAAAALAEIRLLAETATDQLGPMSERIIASSAALSTTLESAAVLMRNLDGVAAANQDELHLAIKDLAAAARSLRALTDYLERNPEAVIFGK